MACEICLGLSEQFTESYKLTWLDFGLQITCVPNAEISPQEQGLYRFFFESGLVWKVDHVDAYGDYWLCVQHGEHSYETLAPVAGRRRCGRYAANRAGANSLSPANPRPLSRPTNAVRRRAP